MPGNVELPEVDCVSASRGNGQIAQMRSLPGENHPSGREGFPCEDQAPGSHSGASHLAGAGSQPQGGNPLLMRAEPRRGSVPTSPSVSGFCPLQRLEDRFRKCAHATGTKGNPAGSQGSETTFVRTGIVCLLLSKLIAMTKNSGSSAPHTCWATSIFSALKCE